MKNQPFQITYSWNDFDNYDKLSSYQKHQVRAKFKEITSNVRNTIQKQIDKAIRHSTVRREELEAHRDPKDPFQLDLGGEG